MKKIIFLSFDILLLIASTIYSLFIFKKVIGKAWDDKKYVKTIILANGPSLKRDIKKISIDKKLNEYYVLNYFALTEYFFEIKPQYYVLTDRMFWDQGVNEDIKKDNQELYNLLERVNWKMSIICPQKGFNWINNRLKKNKKIRVLKVRSMNVEFKNERINLFALYYNITTPNFINGLVMMLWHAIYKKSNDIEIYGADFSLFKEYYVDQKTNDLYSSASHFYKNTNAQNKATHKYPNESKKMLHTRLYQQWSVLSNVFTLIYQK